MQIGTCKLYSTKDISIAFYGSIQAGYPTDLSAILHQFNAPNRSIYTMLIYFKYKNTLYIYYNRASNRSLAEPRKTGSIREF